MSLKLQEIKLSIATLKFYKNYVVCKVKEGVVIGIDEVKLLHETYRAFFDNNQYGIIFDRTIDFTIDPIAYMQCPYYSDITAFAIVASSYSTKSIVDYEKQFSKMSLKTFDTLKKAQNWMEAFNENSEK